MLGNIGNLFLKCIGRVTKGHLYHLSVYEKHFKTSDILSDFFNLYVGHSMFISDMLNDIIERLA